MLRERRWDEAMIASPPAGTSPGWTTTTRDELSPIDIPAISTTLPFALPGGLLFPRPSAALFHPLQLLLEDSKSLDWSRCITHLSYPSPSISRSFSRDALSSGYRSCPTTRLLRWRVASAIGGRYTSRRPYWAEILSLLAYYDHLPPVPVSLSTSCAFFVLPFERIIQPG
ncbi:hypothetical protein B0H13DRAFT_2371852 [Mycena leptocephala]|nr:hypothetical protein B0H13DRAFT_2371852 [Mycena leptocephala]